MSREGRDKKVQKPIFYFTKSKYETKLIMILNLIGVFLLTDARMQRKFS